MKISHAAIGALSAAVLAACSTAPLSYIADQQIYTRTTLNRYPVKVVAIDGGIPSSEPLVAVAPGSHEFLIAAPGVYPRALAIEKKYTLDIAPCTRYYIAADRKNKLERDWDLVVENTESVGGCDPAEELKKAHAAQQARGVSQAGVIVAPASKGPA